MALTITTQSGDMLAASADALILPIYAGEGVGALDGAERFNRQLAPVLESSGFTGKAGQVVAVPTFGKLTARTLVLAGLGARDGDDPNLHGESLRKAYGGAVKRARDEGARTVAAMLPDGADAEAISAAVEGLTLALYRFARYKSASNGEPAKEVGAVELWSSGAVAEDASRTGRQSPRASRWRGTSLTQSPTTRRRRRSRNGRSAWRASPACRARCLTSARWKAVGTTASSPSARGARPRPG